MSMRIQLSSRTPTFRKTISPSS